MCMYMYIFALILLLHIRFRMAILLFAERIIDDWFNVSPQSSISTNPPFASPAACSVCINYCCYREIPVLKCLRFYG